MLGAEPLVEIVPSFVLLVAGLVASAEPVTVVSVPFALAELVAPVVP